MRRRRSVCPRPLSVVGLLRSQGAHVLQDRLCLVPTHHVLPAASPDRRSRCCCRHPWLLVMPGSQGVVFQLRLMLRAMVKWYPETSIYPSKCPPVLIPSSSMSRSKYLACGPICFCRLVASRCLSWEERFDGEIKFDGPDCQVLIAIGAAVKRCIL